MRKDVHTWLLLGLAAHLGGCSFEPKPPPELTAVPLEEEMDFAMPEPLEMSDPAPGAMSVRPPSATASPALPEPGWVSLADYCGLHRVALTWDPSGTMPDLFQLQGMAGLTVVRADSRIGDAQGARFWMAFGPRWFGETPHVHKLDADKTLLPLLQAGPSGFDRRVILIDAGHGGSNQGTRNADGALLEKDLTLDWARRLRQVLEDQGWKTHLSRDRDQALSLSERVEQADRVGAALFVSLHFNSSAPNTARTGIETYCLTPAGLPSTLVRFAPEETARAYPNNGHDTANLLLAMAVHRSLIRRTGAVDRGVRRARFMTVLQGQRRPAILVEGGFLSSPEEAERISEDTYRQELAEAVAEGLEAFLAGPRL